MVNNTITQNHINVHALWQKLVHELMDTFDAHGVCAAVANQIAVSTKTTTLVAVVGPQNKYYDVWICEENGDIKQTRWDFDKASFEPLINAGKATIQTKFSQPASELIKSKLWQLPRKSILAVPLPMPGRYEAVSPPGILCLIDPPATCPLNLETIIPLATNITMVLDRAYLRLHVDRQDIEFAVVSEISYALTSTLSLQNIYRQLMEPVRRTIHVESISVGLIDPVNGDITFVDILLGPLFKNMPPIRLKHGEGIAGWVATHRQPIIVNDVYTDKRFYSKVDKDSGFQTHSMVCIPLQVEERMIGVLQAINKQSSDFNENDLRLLQAISGPLAAAIENSRLHGDVIAEKRRIETIFSSMAEGLLTINSEGYITHANESLLSLLFYELDQVVGKPANKIIQLSSSSLDEFIQLVIDSENNDEYPQLATEIYPDGGSSIPVLLSGATVKGDDNTVSEMIFVFSDLRLIREVERMRDDFFHGIIHELRTPLATILMYARLLREGKARQKEKADRFLGVIERESDRLQKMVKQMLVLAKMEAREQQREPEPTDLNPIFDEMLPPLADRTTEKGLAFHLRIQSDLPTVMGTKDNLYLVFKNLIDNAIKFTLSGTVRVVARAESDQVIVVVKDEGIGIPPHQLSGLFGRFFRAQTAVERGIAGTGLGLYMVKGIIENYSGTIEVESVEEKGTTFTVRLPIAEFQ